MRHPLLKQTAHLLSRRISVLIISLVLLSANPVGLNLALGQSSLANTKIAFPKRDGNWEIYVMNRDGTDPINLTNHPAGDATGLPGLQTEQRLLLSSRDGNWKSITMNRQTS